MALVPLPVDELEQLLVTGVPTAAQYSTYWGRNSREKYGAFLEAATVTFLGVFMSYFISFVLGGFVATLLGSLSAMWILLSPELRAYTRNWELRGGRALVDPWMVQEYQGNDDNVEPEDKLGLYGALFLGRVSDICVVEEASAIEEFDMEEFQDYSMETDELEKWTGNPYLLRVRLTDMEGRNLQVHTRMSEEYLDLEPDQPVVGVLLSTSQKFTVLSALTDFFVPEAECWIGDYPYLNRPQMERVLAEDDDLWDILQSQRTQSTTRDDSKAYDYYDVDVEDLDDNLAGSSGKYSKVPARPRTRRRP